MGKPEEDPESHILRTIDSMDTLYFAMGQQVQRPPLSLAAGVRLWYQSIHPFHGNWKQLKERFSIQLSKIGNTRKQFHAWRSFHFDGNAETTDAYVQKIWQVAANHNYGEPQILKVFISN